MDMMLIFSLWKLHFYELHNFVELIDFLRWWLHPSPSFFLRSVHSSGHWVVFTQRIDFFLHFFNTIIYFYIIISNPKKHFCWKKNHFSTRNFYSQSGFCPGKFALQKNCLKAICYRFFCSGECQCLTNHLSAFFVLADRETLSIREPSSLISFLFALVYFFSIHFEYIYFLFYVIEIGKSP